MIEVESLTRRFGETMALDDLSFQVAAGEIVGFLGPNGAGKTTAMRILTCTLAPSEGSARVAGHEVSDAPLEVRRRIGFMPEHVPLYTDNSVHEFLRFVARLKGVPSATRSSHLAAVEEQTGLTDVRGKLVGHLSKGYRQRVGMAQALVGDPDILILDEPTAGMDPQQNVEIRELIRNFHGRKTVLLSSHILNEVSLTCQRVLILNHGRLVAEETPEVLARQVGTGPCIALIWDGNQDDIRKALAELDGVSEVVATTTGAEVSLTGDPGEVRPRLAATVVAAGGRLQGMRDHSVSLEDMFLRLTSDQEQSQS